MKPCLSNIAHFSLRLLLLRTLRTAVHQWIAQQALDESFKPTCTESFQGPEVPCATIPLKKTQNFTEVSYTCAIALKLAAQTQRPAAEVAHQLEAVLLELPDPASPTLGQFSSSIVWQYSTIQTSSSGWIYLKLTDLGVASWLSQFVHGSDFSQWQLDSPPLYRVGDRLEAAQYAHARCCSLLRLGDREGLIKLKPPKVGSQECEMELLQLQEVMPRMTPSFTCGLDHPAEWYLLSQVMTVVDVCGEAQGGITPQDCLKQAHALSDAFDQFYRHCPIWGESARLKPGQSQLRLGLVLATQRVLHALLQEGLELAAPIEL